MQEQSEASQRCHDIILLFITFVERNPGFARLFAGDALQGETERLRNRMCQLLDRIETQLRQILREHRAQLPELPSYQVNATAKLMLAVAKVAFNNSCARIFVNCPAAIGQSSGLC